MKSIYPPAARRCAVALIIYAMLLVQNSRAIAQTTTPQADTTELDELVREGMAHNPAIIAARAHWKALEYAPIQMRTLPDPQVQAQEFTVGSPKPTAGYETSDFYYTGIGVSQEIPGPGKLRLQGEIAQQDVLVAQHQCEAAQREVAERIRENYFELFYLNKTIGILTEEKDRLAQIEDATQARYSLGQGGTQDVLKAQLQATRLLKEIEHHNREMELRQAELKTTLGRNLDSPNITVGKVEPTLVELNSAQLGELVKSDSTQLQIDRALEQRSEKAFSLARKGYLPDFTIGYAYEKTGARFPDYYMLTVGAKIPLYFRRKQIPAIEEAALEASAARSQLRAHQLEAGASAESQLVAIHASDRILKIYEQGLIPQAENSMEAAMAAYRVAKADLPTALAAFIDVLNLHEEYYREVADHEIAVAKLEQIIGAANEK